MRLTFILWYFTGSCVVLDFCNWDFVPRSLTKQISIHHHWKVSSSVLVRGCWGLLLVSSDKGRPRRSWHLLLWKQVGIVVTTNSDHVCSHLSFLSCHQQPSLQHLIPDGLHCSQSSLMGNLNHQRELQDSEYQLEVVLHISDGNVCLYVHLGYPKGQWIQWQNYICPQ